MTADEIKEINEKQELRALREFISLIFTDKIFLELVLEIRKRYREQTKENS